MIDKNRWDEIVQRAFIYLLNYMGYSEEDELSISDIYRTIAEFYSRYPAQRCFVAEASLKGFLKAFLWFFYKKNYKWFLVIMVVFKRFIREKRNAFSRSSYGISSR